MALDTDRLTDLEMKMARTCAVTSRDRRPVESPLSPLRVRP